MILAAVALAQITFGGRGHNTSANFVEMSAAFDLTLSASAALTLLHAPIGFTLYPPTIDRPENLLIAANNKKSTTTTELAIDGLEVTLVDASTWPDSGAVTLDVASIPARTPDSNEIAYYTSRNGNVLTLEPRGAGGTTAKVWPAGSSVEMRYTAEHHNIHSECIINLQTEVTAVEASLEASLDLKANVADVAADIAALDAAKLDISGGTMTGLLTLSGAPTLDLHAVTKRYVDDIGLTHYNAKNFGCAGDGVTDDTAAIIALQDALVAAGGGRIYFPRGVYVIGGPFLDPTGHNAQIPIPLLGQYNPPITIEWVGELSPPHTCSTQAKPTGYTHSIIKGTRTDGSLNASLIGGKEPVDGGGTNWLGFNLKDMVFELPPDPTYTCLNFINQLGNKLEKILIHDGSISEQQSAPTHSNSYGVKLSPTNHSSRIDVVSLNVLGFFLAVRSGELAYGSMIAQGCQIALEVPFAYHPTKFNILGSYGCPYTIRASGNGPCAILIDLLSMQDNTGYGDAWQARVYNIDDPGNHLRGRYNWTNVRAAFGVIHDLINNGGANFIGTEVW